MKEFILTKVAHVSTWVFDPGNRVAVNRPPGLSGEVGDKDRYPL